MTTFFSLTLGVMLASGAASALAGAQDRANLELCQTDIRAVYGEGTRLSLRSIKRDDLESHLRILARPAGGGNKVVICTVSSQGERSLADQDGMALRREDDARTVSMTR